MEDVNFSVNKPTSFYPSTYLNAFGDGEKILDVRNENIIDSNPCLPHDTDGDSSDTNEMLIHVGLSMNSSMLSPSKEQLDVINSTDIRVFTVLSNQSSKKKKRS